MIDREKVLKGLENCSQTQLQCWKCPYSLDPDDPGDCVKELMEDALDLLKENQVSPKKITAYNFPVTVVYEEVCENCKSPILYKQPYCAGCGRKVIWDEQD